MDFNAKLKKSDVICYTMSVGAPIKMECLVGVMITQMKKKINERKKNLAQM